MLFRFARVPSLKVLKISSNSVGGNVFRTGMIASSSRSGPFSGPGSSWTMRVPLPSVVP